MEVLFKKYFWVLNSLFLVGFGFATSRTLSSYLEYEVFKVPYVDEVMTTESSDLEDDNDLRRPTASRSVDYERRKQLSQTAAPEVSDEQAELPEEQEDPFTEEEKPLEEEGPPAEINVEFIAAITSSDPAKNLALVRVDGGQNRWVFLEDELKPGFKVTGISNYYLMVSQGVNELLWIKKEPKPMDQTALAGGPGRLGQPPPMQNPVASGPAAQDAEPPPSSNSPYASGIKQVGPSEYNIDRAMLNEQLQDLGKLGREARVIPNYDRDTQTYKGFKLIGVRPNSLYRAIGIRSGDVIARVNGEELSNPGKALELFNKLQTSNDISLDIVRRGKQQTLTYKIE